MNSKITNQLKTFALWIADRSGSMLCLEKTHIRGYNKFINEQKNNNNGEFYLSTIRFDNSVEFLHKMEPIDTVPDADDYTFQSRGSTALYDSLGIGLKYILNLHSINNDKNARYMVMVMTDGHENCSKEFTKKSINELITECNKKDICVKFMGANQDAEKTGRLLGIEKENCMTFTPTPKGLSYLMRTVSNSVTRCRSGVCSDFTEIEKSMIEMEKMEENKSDKILDNISKLSEPPTYYKNKCKKKSINKYINKSINLNVIKKLSFLML